jgi:hypothetical protein
MRSLVPDLSSCCCACAGRALGDLVHPLPYCPELFSPEFSSTVADMKVRMVGTHALGW